MTEDFNAILAKAVLRMLRPLVRVLLRYGVPYGVLAELARQAYVDVAWRDFPPSARKQTISHVSALTGLTRKDVRRLVEREGQDVVPDQARYSRAIRVISGWVNDSEFHGNSGDIATLPVEGEQKSFAALVRKYSGDIPVQAMLVTLSESGVVHASDGMVTLLRNAYVPARGISEKIEILGIDTAELISTIEHNLTADAGESRFQRKVTYDNIDPASVEKLRKLSSRKAQLLLESLDREFSQHDQDVQGKTGGKYISVGIYYHEHDDSGE